MKSAQHVFGSHARVRRSTRAGERRASSAGPSNERWTEGRAGAQATQRPGFIRLCTHAAAFILSFPVLWLAPGCETLQETTLEADRGTYFEAHRFLKIGRTTRRDVLRKYGKPNYVLRERGTEIWYYRTREAVVVNAYSGTTVGTESAMLTGRPGFTRVVERTRGMDVAFGPDGVLRTYRVYRTAPPPPADARRADETEFQEQSPPARGGQPE